VTRGEAVRCVVDYELFECGNVNGDEGCYIYYSESNDKHLVYFSKCGEWAELKDEEFERINKPGYIPKKNRDFIRKVRRLKVTLVT
tara:strand:- start:5111 stop:5368 length:258 start_codon:yes stop_codon:yes gene_type:complete